VKVFLDGTLRASGWSVDTTTGIVTFGTAPTLGVEVTADFAFDVPVRFDTDHMAVTIESYRLHAWQQIPIVELRT
jgi:uncharacterized protein (TIGR02217 family)